MDGAEIDAVRAFGTEVRVEAVGLLREMTKPSFLLIANCSLGLPQLIYDPN